jgi:hypothetical protein
MGWYGLDYLAQDRDQWKVSCEYYGPGVDSASNRIDYQKSSWR